MIARTISDIFGSTPLPYRGNLGTVDMDVGEDSTTLVKETVIAVGNHSQTAHYTAKKGGFDGFLVVKEGLILVENCTVLS